VECDIRSAHQYGTQCQIHRARALVGTMPGATVGRCVAPDAVAKPEAQTEAGFVVPWPTRCFTDSSLEPPEHG
jgi:hypothetical protein